MKIPKPLDLYDIARFFSNVAVKGLDDCWHYHGTRLTSGYGQFIAINERWLAHRFSYLVCNGVLEPDLVVRHKCDCKTCVNPFHLETGTVADNNRDRDIRMRTAKGSKNGRSKLQEEQVIAILHSQDPHEIIARQYGVERSTIGRIKNGTAWNHITKLKRKGSF